MRKTLSILLVIILLLSALPTTALAAEDDLADTGAVLITDVELTIDMPVGGEKPSYTAIVPKDAGYRVILSDVSSYKDGVAWAKTTNGCSPEYLTPGADTFKTGENYYVYFRVEPAGDKYIFPENRSDITVTVNGKEAEWDSLYSDFGNIRCDIGKASDPSAEYGLWLGSTQVTGSNFYDILNDGGKAKFDPSTNTLTLNNPTITGEYNYSTIFCSGFDLTVKGIYSMSAAQSDAGINVIDHNLTLDGYFAFHAWSEAVKASYDITVSGGTLVAKLEDGSSWQNGAIISDLGNLIFGDDVDCVEAEVTGTSSTLCAVNYNIEGTVTLSSNVRLMTPENGQFREGRCYYYSSGKTRLAKQVSIVHTTPSDNKYDVWVGSTQVTKANQNDILSDGGKAKYDPSTNTLTINDPSISGDYESSAIYSGGDLILRGSGRLSARSFGVNVQGDLTINGDFTFSGKSGSGVATKGDLVFLSGELSATGVYCKGKMTVRNTVTKLESSSESGAVYAKEGLELGSKLAITEPDGGRYVQPSVREADGETVAARVVIARPIIAYDLWVGDTQVTDENKDDILNDGGKAKFDPETNTLTLNDPVISDVHVYTYEYSWGTSYYPCMIFSDSMDLNIKGSWHMSSRTEADYAVLSEDGSVTLDGDFDLSMSGSCVSAFGGDITFNSGKFNLDSTEDDCINTDGNVMVGSDVTDISINCNGSAIDVSGDLHVDCERLTIVTKEDCGLLVGGKLEFSSNVKKADITAGDDYAFIAGSLEIDEALSVTVPAGARVDTVWDDIMEEYYQTVLDGDSPALHVVIEPEQSSGPARLLGDADGNDLVNVFDAAYVQKGLTGTKNYPQYTKLDKSDLTYRVADADGDGTVNIFDAALIQKFLTGASSAKGYGIGEPLKSWTELFISRGCRVS